MLFLFVKEKKIGEKKFYFEKGQVVRFEISKEEVK
jgi:hypothetical protein